MIWKQDAAYVPALRMKQGERRGLMDLSSDVADRILPRIIVPPLGERDDALQRSLLADARTPEIATVLAGCWHDRPILVEATYLARDPGLEDINAWLPCMFERARRAGVRAIPLARAADLAEASLVAYRSARAEGPIAISIVVTPDEVDGTEAIAVLLERLQVMEVTPSTCTLIIDFSGSDLSDPKVAAPIVVDTITRLLAAAVWGLVVFQGTSYPDTNLAPVGGCYVVERNEWRTWLEALADDPSIATQVVFGDYAADCAKMRFDSGGRPIPHLRYTTSSAWLIQRGMDKVRYATAMRDVCQRIVEHQDFAGDWFSSADEKISRVAAGEADAGQATDWRAMNTTHHVTRVVADLGQFRGYKFQRRLAPPRPTQITFFG